MNRRLLLLLLGNEVQFRHVTTLALKILFTCKSVHPSQIFFSLFYSCCYLLWWLCWTSALPLAIWFYPSNFFCSNRKSVWSKNSNNRTKTNSFGSFDPCVPRGEFLELVLSCSSLFSFLLLYAFSMSFLSLVLCSVWFYRLLVTTDRWVQMPVFFRFITC